VNQISYVSNDERLAELFKAAGLRATKLSEAEARALGKAGDAPAVLILDVRPHHDLAPWLMELQKKQPSLAVVLIVSVLEAKFMLDAMRAGIKECLPEPVSAHALEEAVRRLVVGELGERPGSLVAFVGAKGGVGTTTLAANVAAAATKVSGTPALLVDLHVTRGDVAVFMGAEARFSVLDALENLHKVDESFLAGLVEKSKCGVHVLASSARSTAIDIPSSAVRTLLDFATRRYRLTIVDVPRGDQTALESLDSASTIVLVTGQDLASVRSAAATAAMLRQRYGSQRLKVVINRHDKSGTVSSKDVARVIGEPIAHLIPSDYHLAVEAVNLGRPIVLDEGRLSKVLRHVAVELTSLGKPEARKSQSSGVLGRLSWRRA
jgi:pilus assembly protein CpaE